MAVLYALFKVCNWVGGGGGGGSSTPQTNKGNFLFFVYGKLHDNTCLFVCLADVT
jgi:hypothetical protein